MKGGTDQSRAARRTFRDHMTDTAGRRRSPEATPGRVDLHALLTMLVVAFLAVPVLLFAQFHVERRNDETLLLKAMRGQMTTIGAALSAEIRESGLASYAALDDRLKALTPPDMRIKILYRPAQGPLSEAFLYVATSEEIDSARLAREREELMRVGILSALSESCSVDTRQMFRFGSRLGHEELIVGVVPIRTDEGCWAVVASYAKGGFLESAVARPPWQVPRVQVAFAAYAAMALVVFAILLRIHQSVKALRETASAISTNLDEPVQFAAVSDAPELDSTARTLDHMVEELRRARLEAIHANESKTRYLANISHELRTPLNAIIGFSQVIQNEMFGPISERRYVEYAADIQGSGRYLLGMINDVLDLSRLEAGRFELTIEPVDPNDNIRWAVRLLTGQARERRHVIDVVLAEQLPMVNADIRAFRSIAVNLLTNAVKYTPEGGRIEVRSRATEDGGVAVTIADNGDGIAPADLERVFEPYGRGSDGLTAQREGTGLGLPLVRHLVELQGGRLDFDSVVGVGTTVTVILLRAPSS